MGSKCLWLVVIVARVNSEVCPEITAHQGETRADHRIYVYTDKGAGKAGDLAVAWLGEGWADKMITKIELVGDIVVSD